MTGSVVELMGKKTGLGASVLLVVGVNGRYSLGAGAPGAVVNGPGWTIISFHCHRKKGTF